MDLRRGGANIGLDFRWLGVTIALLPFPTEPGWMVSSLLGRLMELWLSMNTSDSSMISLQQLSC